GDSRGRPYPARARHARLPLRQRARARLARHRRPDLPRAARHRAGPDDPRRARRLPVAGGRGAAAPSGVPAQAPAAAHRTGGAAAALRPAPTCRPRTGSQETPADLRRGGGEAWLVLVTNPAPLVPSIATRSPATAPCRSG